MGDTHAASSSKPSTIFSVRSSLRRTGTIGDGDARKVCKHGTQCYRRNPDHIREEAHPADPDYLDACRAHGVEPEFVSIRKLYAWCADENGKAARSNLEQVWPVIQKLGHGVGALNDALWKELDDDGNGCLNFSEFAEFTTKFQVGLPLGLDDLMQVGEKNEGATLRCGVCECQCTNFRPRRRRCKYGEKCYQKNPEHQLQFCHPGDEEWATSQSFGDQDMCVCGHKRKLHASSMQAAGAVEYPKTWAFACSSGDSDFLKMVPVDAELADKFQLLVDNTYSDVTTRDRARHNGGSWMVPSHYTVQAVRRNENSKLWRKYAIKRAELQEEKRACDQNPEVAAAVRWEDAPAEYGLFEDVVTSKVWSMLSASDDLDKSVNEWYLFHGTSASAAQNICSTDFKMRLAGSSTGTLYGKGSYFAENVTKADEYAKAEGDVYTLLLCRVLGGRVKYCAEREPDANALVKACVEGPYDCVVGDRRRISGTYREFVIFDAENVYPEYVISYKRGELFKSKSHP